MVELLQYAFIAAPYLIAFGLAIGLVAFCLTAFRSPTAGIALYILLFWFDALFPDAPPLQLGLFIYVADVVSVMVGLVALLRALFARSRPPIPGTRSPASPPRSGILSRSSASSRPTSTQSSNAC